MQPQHCTLGLAQRLFQGFQPNYNRGPPSTPAKLTVLVAREAPVGLPRAQGQHQAIWTFPVPAARLLCETRQSGVPSLMVEKPVSVSMSDIESYFDIGRSVRLKQSARRRLCRQT
jgi:hypothetical protein